MGRGNKSFFKASGPHDKDGRHAHICLKNCLLRNQWTDFYETWYVAFGTQSLRPIIVSSNDDPRVDFDLNYGKVKLCNFRVLFRKK